MSFTLVAYGELKTRIDEAIKKLLTHHVIKTPDELSSERRIQVQVLLKTIELCDNIKVSKDEKDEKPATILNAAVYYIHLQIEKTYQRTSPTNSNLYNSLTTCLALSDTNTPSSIEQRNLFAALNLFQRGHMYMDGDAAKGILATQAFDIKGYSIKADNRELTKIHNQLVLEIDENAWELHDKPQDKAQDKAQVKSKGLFGSLFGSSTAPESSTVASEAKKPAHG